MLPILADVLPDPSSSSSIGWVLAVLFGLASGALILKQLFWRDPPLHREYVDRESYLRDREEMRSELSRNASARKTNYERLEEQGRDISSLQTQVTEQSGAIAEIAKVGRETSSKVDGVSGELKIINQQVQQIATTLIRRS